MDTRDARDGFLENLSGTREDPILHALKNAPADDVPLSREEAKQSEAAWEDYLQGRDPGEALPV